MANLEKIAADLSSLNGYRAQEADRRYEKLHGISVPSDHGGQ